jgi:pimeloyl-ACP methyl ester carboxylesterase
VGETRVGGLRIRYLDSASEAEAKLTLLCVHGYGGNAMDFSLLPRHTPGHVRLIAFDFPGSGRSDPTPDHLYPMELYLRVLEHMIERFAVDGLVAHSLGGKVALNWTHRHPEMFDRLVLIAPYGLEEQEGRALARLGSRPWMVKLGFALSNRWAMRINVRRRIFYDPDKIDGPTARAGEESQLSRHGRRAMAAVTLGMIGPDPIDPILPEIPVSVLLLWGGDDRLLLPSWGPVYRDALPDARLEVMPECGHLVMVEKAEETAARIVAFMGDGR